MWARTAEILLGCWLAISPFVFRHDPGHARLWMNDLGCAAVVIALASLSFHPRLAMAHLAQVLVSGWLLVGVLRVEAVTMMPALQNHAVIALVLVMLAVVPTRSSQPPQGWRRFYEQREGHPPDNDKG